MKRLAQVLAIAIIALGLFVVGREFIQGEGLHGGALSIVVVGLGLLIIIKRSENKTQK